MNHFLNGRHYVALGRRGLRRHLVFVTVAVSDRRSIKLRYDIASRHFTRRGAEKRARALNAARGRTH